MIFYSGILIFYYFISKKYGKLKINLFFQPNTEIRIHWPNKLWGLFKEANKTKNCKLLHLSQECQGTWNCTSIILLMILRGLSKVW
jgi:hypothetical protein